MQNLFYTNVQNENCALQVGYTIVLSRLDTIMVVVAVACLMPGYKGEGAAEQC